MFSADRNGDYYEKAFKNPLFYVMYFIPQLIMTHAVSTFNKTFPMARHVLQIIIYIFMIGILMIFVHV